MMQGLLSPSLYQKTGLLSPEDVYRYYGNRNDVIAPQTHGNPLQFNWDIIYRILGLPPENQRNGVIPTYPMPIASYNNSYPSYFV